MEEKYKILTSEPPLILDTGERLYPIKAVRDIKTINKKIVKKGTIGGHVEKAKNLSTVGECWLEAGSIAYGSAVIEKNALVIADSVIKGAACITHDAVIRNSTIEEYAKIANSSFVEKSVVSGNADIRGSSNISASNIKGNVEISSSDVGYSDIYGSASIKTSHVTFCKLGGSTSVELCDVKNANISCGISFYDSSITCNIDKDVFGNSLSLYPEKAYSGRYLANLENMSIKRESDISFFPIFLKDCAGNKVLFAFMVFHREWKYVLCYWTMPHNDFCLSFEDALLTLKSFMFGDIKREIEPKIANFISSFLDDSGNFLSNIARNIKLSFPLRTPEESEFYNKLKFYVFCSIAESLCYLYDSSDRDPYLRFWTNLLNASEIDLKTSEIISAKNILISSEPILAFIGATMEKEEIDEKTIIETMNNFSKISIPAQHINY